MIIRQPRNSELKALRTELRKYGDVPPEEAVEATRPKNRTQWLVVFENNKIIGAGRTYKTDWYEWTVKNAFVIPSERGKKVATLLYAELTDKAEREGAKVAEADITASNISSKRAAVRAGMRPVNNFVWNKNKTHADIYQEVFTPPTQKQVNTVNKVIRSEFTKRQVRLTPGILSPQPLFYKKRRK